MERLFGLDFQLLHDAFWTAAAVFLLFFALSYLLFNPAREMLKKRREKIEKERMDAALALSEANRMKAEYEEKMADAKKDAAAILDESRRRAMKSENDIVNEAKEEAVEIRRQALADIEQEKLRARDDVKKEMVSLASALAGKAVFEKMSFELQDELVNETLNAVGEETWQDQ